MWSPQNKVPLRRDARPKLNLHGNVRSGDAGVESGYSGDSLVHAVRDKKVVKFVFRARGSTSASGITRGTQARADTIGEAEIRDGARLGLEVAAHDKLGILALKADVGTDNGKNVHVGPGDAFAVMQVTRVGEKRPAPRRLDARGANTMGENFVSADQGIRYAEVLLNQYGHARGSAVANARGGGEHHRFPAVAERPSGRMKECFTMEVVLLNERDMSVSDLQESLDAPPSGPVARGDAQCKRVARVRRAQIRRVAVSTREAVLLRGGERRSTTDATVEGRPKMETPALQLVGAARFTEIARRITARRWPRFIGSKRRRRPAVMRRRRCSRIHIPGVILHAWIHVPDWI